VNFVYLAAPKGPGLPVSGKHADESC
jgi:hypothetical protein